MISAVETAGSARYLGTVPAAEGLAGPWRGHARHIVQVPGQIQGRSSRIGKGAAEWHPKGQAPFIPNAL